MINKYNHGMNPNSRNGFKKGYIPSTEHREKIKNKLIGKVQSQELIAKRCIKRRLNNSFKQSPDVYKKIVNTRHKNNSYICSPSSKIKHRIAVINHIKKVNGIFRSMIGKNEYQILNKLESLYGSKILRQYEVDGYFLDGYIKELNIAIEIDEPAHKKQSIKDIERQKYVENKLGCKFLRIEDRYYK